MNDTAFTHVVSDHIDHSLLRNLDQRTPTGKFPLIVVTTPFAMRGIDYRAPKNGITQIIATSFKNKREALQGQERVGRFGDPCLRISIDGIPLIDKE
jgi:hypothetical protein